MNAVGIVCEFNPLHKGHEYFLGQVKKAFPEKGIVCVMSGNFVQRGSFAIQEKFSRARSAIFAGADLVLELPFPFSSLSGESFGTSAISILKRLGICDTLAFGTEIPDPERMLTCAKNLSDPSFLCELKQYLEENRGVGYPTARERVYETMFGREEILSSSNASLAMEYILAAQALSFPVSFYPVKRLGEQIRSEKEEGEFLSATAIRKMILSGGDPMEHLPAVSFDEMIKEKEKGHFPVSMETLSPILFYLLKTKSRKEMKEIYGFSALCDRARKFAGESESVEDLVRKMKNASVTDSRIRRGLLALLLNIPRHAEKEAPLYTQVLAAGEKGREMISKSKECGSIPVFTKPAHALRSEDQGILRQASAAHLADEIYQMAFPKKETEGYFLKQTPAIF